MEEDWTQSHDLADEYPDKLADLQRLFLIQAARFKVLPMDTRSAERFNDELVGRPTLIQGTSQTFYPGMKRLSENSVINVKNKSHSITAKVTVPESGANGVILVQGGAFGGWSVYTKDGYLKYTYNVLGLNEYTTTSDQPLSPGDHEVRMEFDYEAAVSVKAAPSPSTRTDTPSVPGRWNEHCLSCSRWTKRWTSESMSPPPSPASTARPETVSPGTSRGHVSISGTTTTVTWPIPSTG